MFRIEMSIDMDEDSHGASIITAESTNLVSLKANTASLILKCCEENNLSIGEGTCIRKVLEFDNVLSVDKLYFTVLDGYKKVEMR